MRALVGLVLVAALAACGSKHEAQAASGGCDLAGLYRLRFDLGAGQWLWLRFRIAPDGLSATLEKPWAFARDKHAAPIKVDAEPAACKASLIASSTTADIHAAITLDPKTNTVTGKLELVGGRTGVPLEGVRDAGAVPTGHTCISPGMYRLVVPKDQVWRSDEKDGDCDDAELSVSFLIEPFGDKLLVEEINPDGTSAWAAEDAAIVEPCDVEVRLRHRAHMVQARLTFGGDQVTALGRYANVQDVSASGDVVQCKIDEPMLWVERERG